MAFHDEPTRESKTAQASIADFFDMADFPGKWNICPLRQRPEELLALIDELDQRDIGFRALSSPMNTTTSADWAFLQVQAAFLWRWSATSSAARARECESRLGARAERRTVPHHDPREPALHPGAS